MAQFENISTLNKLLYIRLNSYRSPPCTSERDDVNYSGRALRRRSTRMADTQQRYKQQQQQNEYNNKIIII